MTEPRLAVWPPLPPDAYARRRTAELPFPLDRPDVQIYSRARHALYKGLDALGLGSGDEILMPAYHHGSEVEALVRAGLTLRFYEAHERLEPDEQELEALVTPRTCALYLIHYLGFPQAADRWRRWCDDRGLLLIEDAAQAWLATIDERPVGSFGDLAIFCLYKTFGLPDGSALVARRVPAQAPRPMHFGVAAVVRSHGAWVMSRSQRAAALGARLSLRHSEYVAADDFALGDPEGGPVRSSLFLLQRLFDGGTAAQRRANYSELLTELRDHVPAPFAELPEGASPFAFPLATDDKRTLLRRLEERGLNVTDLWSTPHPAVPDGRFPGAAQRRASTVALPVHQELRPLDVERVARTITGRPRPRPGFQVETVFELAPLREEWTRLAHASGNVFATWEWASIWWSHFGARRPLRVTTLRDRGGDLVGVLPLYVWSGGPLRVLRFLGHSGGDQLGPICAPPDRAAVAREIRRVLADRRWPWDLLVGEQLSGDEGWGALLGGKTLRWSGNPTLRFGGRTWPDILATHSARFRKRIRQYERRLASAGEVRFRLCDDAAQLDDDLDTLFALHGARWRESESAFLRHRSFHRDFARCAFDNRWLRLWLLEVGGEPIAAWHGFRFENREFYYQAGRNPAWESYSVGFLLLVHTIRRALEDGADEYRFLRGGEDYKYRFANADPGLETIALSRGALGGAALVAAGALPGSALRLWQR